MNRPVPKNEDLHGNTPDSCPVIFLLVDMLNDVDFIYVNDNRGKWRSDVPQSYLTAFAQVRLAVRWSVN